MKIRIAISYIFLIASVFHSCTISSPKVYKGNLMLADSLQINLSVFSKSLRTDIGFHSIRIKDSSYLGFISNSLKVNLCNINLNTNVISYPLPDSLNLSKNHFSIKFFNEYLYIYLHNKRTIYSYIIQDTGLHADKTFELSQILAENEYLLFNYENTFEINYPYLCIAYGIMDRKKNYLDENRYFLIDLSKRLTTDNKKKILHTQKAFINQKYYNTGTQIKISSDSALLYGFNSSDSLYKYSLKSDLYILKSNFSNHSNFRKHNKSMESDLGYLRWQESTNEVNLIFLTLENGDYFIIKKLKTERIADKKTYEFYVVNRADFSIKANNTFPENFLLKSCLPYKNGIIVFTDSLQKAYYYEPSK